MFCVEFRLYRIVKRLQNAGDWWPIKWCSSPLSSLVSTPSPLCSPLWPVFRQNIQYLQHNLYSLNSFTTKFLILSSSVGQYLTNLCSLFWIKFQKVIPAWAVSLTCSVFSSSNPDTRRRIRKFVQNNTHCISLTLCVQNLRKIPITSQVGDPSCLDREAI